MLTNSLFLHDYPGSVLHTIFDKGGYFHLIKPKLEALQTTPLEEKNVAFSFCSVL